MLRTHLDKTYPGAMVASLSVPWGDTGNERGGYHLVWPRDLVECAGALLALGAESEARDTLRYLIATQNEDGHWHQNQWLGGSPYWQGVQLDETAFPVLLAAALDERDAPARHRGRGHGAARARLYRAHRALHPPGPLGGERGHQRLYARASAIAALVAGAALLPSPAGDWALALADFWNAQIEAWTTRRRHRAGPATSASPAIMCGSRRRAIVAEAGSQHRDRADPQPRATTAGLRGDEQVGTEFLQLVRFGLRRADDPLIRGSRHAWPMPCCAATRRTGPVWHRYRGDGYGEHDGRQRLRRHRHRPGLAAADRRARPFRAGRRKRPAALPEAMAAMTSPGGMIPEQVWDADPIPQRRLCPRPANRLGDATRLGACRVRQAVGIAPTRPSFRSAARGVAALSRTPAVPRYAFWWPHAAIGSIASRGEACCRARPSRRWCIGDAMAGSPSQDTPTSDTGLGFHVAELPTAALPPGTRIEFTWRREDTGEWHGKDEAVAIMPPPDLDDCRTSAGGARR